MKTAFFGFRHSGWFGVNRAPGGTARQAHGAFPGFAYPLNFQGSLTGICPIAVTIGTTRCRIDRRDSSYREGNAVRNVWNDVSVGAGWAACLLLGLAAGDGHAAALEEAVAAAVPAAEAESEVASSLSFGKAWQIPAWIDPRSDAGVEDVAGEESNGGIDLVGFFSRHADCRDCEPTVFGHHQYGAACDRWTGTVDAMFLWQNNMASRPLFISTSTLQTAVDANQLQTPASVGPRFGLFYHLDNGTSIEGNYFNVQSFAGEYQTPSVTDGYAAVDLASTVPYVVDGVQAISSGEIQSAEINLRRGSGVVTWLAGFRWVEWNGTLDVRSSSVLGEDLVSAVTGNDLYGGQLGADVLLWKGWRGLQVNGLGKAGVFYNTAYQSTSASVATQPPYAGSARSAADQTAFFGELGINGAWQLTDCLAWRVGYSFFWLSGVATPAEQLSLVDVVVSPPTSSINTEGSVFLQGVTTGLEARW